MNFSILSPSTLYELFVNKNKGKFTRFSLRKRRWFNDFQPIKIQNSSSNLQWQVHQFSHLLNSNLSINREDAYRTKSPETLINTRFSKKKSLAAEATRLVTHRGFEPRTPWLKVKCSANWANESGGEASRIRTGGLQGHNLAL